MRWHLLIIVLALQACANVPPRNPVPEEFISAVDVPGAPLARMWGDEIPPDYVQRYQEMEDQLRQARGSEFWGAPQSFLSISGGGAEGAFGAGLLKGWSESGTRPEFLIVTGISTGALIAPFAFLGSDYDDELERLYTTLSTSDLITRRALIPGLTGDALADTAPMRELLKQTVDEAMIARIAEEYERGRRLLIGTTNLDAKRPVLWNIGQIATQGTPESRQLIRDVMLASASIPGVFPPVRIPVTLGDKTYDELHVDGGVTSQVFLMPAAMSVRAAADELELTGELTEYVVRNGALDPRWSAIKPKLTPVLAASFVTLVRNQGLGDLYRIYLRSIRDELVFRLAYVPIEFEAESEEMFDTVYMRELFDFAYEKAANGYDWKTVPPGLPCSESLDRVEGKASCEH
jgi:hypothetical protein